MILNQILTKEDLREKLCNDTHRMIRKSDGQMMNVWKSRCYPDYSISYTVGNDSFNIIEVSLDDIFENLTYVERLIKETT